MLLRMFFFFFRTTVVNFVVTLVISCNFCSFSPLFRGSANDPTRDCMIFPSVTISQIPYEGSHLSM